MNIGLTRLANQRVLDRPFTQPAEVVAWLGAMQAQDYTGALWSIGLRMIKATEQTVAQALADRTIVRTWPMRGTLHFVAAADARWLLALLTPRMIAQSAGRYRQLALDEATFTRSKARFANALQGGNAFTRDEMYHLLAQANIATAGQRGYHLLLRAGQDGLICFGAPSANQQTFVLLDEWIPPTPPLARDEALAELARRYFTSHGPATVPDLARWAGITLTDAKRAVEGAGAALIAETSAGQLYLRPHATPTTNTDAAAAYLLPGFDEFVLGYGERSAVLDPAYAQRICPGGNGVFTPTVVINGQIQGTWKRTFKKGAVLIEWTPFQSFPIAAAATMTAAAQHYGAFLGLPVTTPAATDSP